MFGCASSTSKSKATLATSKRRKANPGSFLARATGRALMAPLLVIGAQSALQNSGALAGMVEGKAKEIGLDNLPVSAEDLVKLNAYSQIAMAGTLSLGIFPRITAAGLIASLVPTTLVGHAFWEIEDEGERGQQKLQFAKNAAVIGGLLNIIGRR